MSNATHRKTSQARLPRVPVAYIATAGILLALTVALLAGLAAVTAPVTKAGTGYLKPAVTAVRNVEPYWDGRHPAVWTSEDEPLCHARYAGRYAWLRIDNYGPGVRLMCSPNGPVYDWQVITGPLTWARVTLHCLWIGCVRPSAAILRGVGYGPRQVALMHVADTTVIWVRLPHGRVKTYTS